MSVLAPAPTDEVLTFGPFRLQLREKSLLEASKPVRLGSRALDILIALAEHAGELVRKDELIERVWPNTFVDETNLRVHVAALRKILGDGQNGARYILNVPGRGYRFVAPVTRSSGSRASIEPSPASVLADTLPAPLVRMIGHAETVDTLAALLPKRRFLTIVGPGGIGKSTVSLAVAERLLAKYASGLRYVDFGAIADASLVPSALAAVLGLVIPSENSISYLIAHLSDKETLIVLDNCERVVAAAAEMAEKLLKGVPGVSILATSREPLRAEGEWVHRLRPLESPPQAAAVSAAEAMTYSAVQLFVERAMATLETFELSDVDAPTVGDICGRLEGIPLAIELAAARLDIFGIRELAARLDGRFLLLARGRRTASPRHQTLRAVLDWSYDLLTPTEQAIFRRISVFRGEFTLDAAAAVAADGAIGTSDVVDGVISLGAKSLLTTDVMRGNAQHRLLNMARAYAYEKLLESEDSASVHRRHAELCREPPARAESD